METIRDLFIKENSYIINYKIDNNHHLFIENLENCIYWYEISDETIYKLFSGISFVEEDFLGV